MYERDLPLDTSSSTPLLFRLALVLAFLVIIGRLFFLQVVQKEVFQESANNNRYDLIETAAPRGVIYDRNKVILARNRPSFEISLVPQDLPFDDPATSQDEEKDEVVKILQALRADSDTEIALRISEIMFRYLGYADYDDTLKAANIEHQTVEVLAYQILGTAPDTPNMVGSQPRFVEVPDISIPLPMDGLVALVQRAVELGRQGTASQAVPILDLVDRIKAFEIAEDSYRLKSVRVDDAPVREYVYGELFSHVLGFMGPIPKESLARYNGTGYTNINEKVGLNGLEYSYQTELRGQPGYKNIEVDILGREMRTVGEDRKAVSGSNLVLNIYRPLQQVMQDSLQAMMTEKESKWAVAIAMNPQNGAILGLVSLPSYDNNIFAERIGKEYEKLALDERRPLLNYAISGQYPPGSTFKIVTATAALAEGVISPDTRIVDAGPIYLPNLFAPGDSSLAQEFVSWNHKLGIVHGPLTVIDGLALSNDIFFYWIGGGYPPAKFQGLNDKKLAHWAELFGYGKPTGIDIPGEGEIVIPDDQWKRQLWAESWTTGDSYNMAIGQGYVLGTPLQVLVSMAAIANGGTIYEPQIVYQVIDAAGGLQRDFTPKVVRQLPVAPELIETVRKGLWTAVNGARGTAVASRIEGIEVAGKTGTAEYCDYQPEEFPDTDGCRRDEKDNLPTHAWYAAFAPYENPEIAVVVFVHDGGEGSATALPVAKTILEAYFKEIKPR